MTDLPDLLRAQRRRVADLDRDLAAMQAASVASNADDEHDPEGATVAFERQQLVALRDAALRTREELEEAIDRDERGQHGSCRGCGRAISRERLEARPQATTCIACARAGG